MKDLFAAAEAPRVSVRGLGLFPVHRIYCVGRNFADHAREMGASAPASKAERGQPTFFMKPADALVIGSDSIPYPSATQDLHHEVELVVALGQDAPAGVLGVEDATALVLAYGVGLDLTRRDLQAAAKARGLPWDIAKGFDHSAPISELIPAGEVGALEALNLSLEVNGQVRQQSLLDQMIWNVPEILHELSKLFALRAGDLVFMGTPAGVAALQPGDRFSARLENVAERHGTIVG
ncbi:fumarylacetoacetate hydrolase family protein [Xanthomonas translucens]|uniref:Fumarylacetoacetate hydrolase n=3 Tax=Xanthomonas campestris pv. translucens TaxID=343 RepID=A0A120EYD0_XANCT|nr:fumarylacetoacetate hydrolase family protein [Xanthomonas translucens]AKK68622.1 fumarylacetoacetate hydrolase [Xanthomonas translucens pv. undulosa]AVY65870.1 fumarylacetoacetate hydrolase [Xanthomonas translucens pv. undulosa]ELQ15866.1 fumarylacetoacetate hydrolase family protein [Xanthomonas translucens DAR61454]KTF39220.1 fumarylacetoacetate hydrolase [Xanthomonas translucens pv. translucens]KWV10538.1 fumarylacetoacetate hydrolase [Xanthomonas translucens]